MEEPEKSCEFLFFQQHLRPCCFCASTNINNIVCFVWTSFRQGVPDDRKIWSATAVVNEPYHQTLVNVHKSFLSAGSRAVTTNSYGIVPGVGFSLPQIVQHVATSARLARESVGTDHQDALVLGSLGPLVESYRPDLILPHEEGTEFYEAMMEAMNPYIDVFLAETMSCYAESAQAVDAKSKRKDGKPIMVSYTLDGKGALRDGESVSSCLRRLLDFTNEKQVVCKWIVVSLVNGV